jgi:Periplasmic component of the Tol biopolymer transport system
MKKLILFSYLLVTAITINAQQTDFPKLTGPYLGQKPPGMTPEIFSPGIISFGYHEHRMAISPDGREIFYSVANADDSIVQIMSTKNINGSWTIPEVASFSNIGMNLHPAFSPDGKRIYFASTRLAESDGKLKKDTDIWFVERRGEDWSDPIHLPNTINTINNESSPSLMADGTLYFEKIIEKEKCEFDIYYSSFENNSFQEAIKLLSPVNTDYIDLGPFISPDGSYLLFYSYRPGTQGGADLYIAFKNDDGTWKYPVNLGEKINSSFIDWAPIITPDGKYLVFSSYRNIDPVIHEDNTYTDALRKGLGEPKIGDGTFYWVSAKIIEELRSKE